MKVLEIFFPFPPFWNPTPTPWLRGKWIPPACHLWMEGRSPHSQLSLCWCYWLAKKVPPKPSATSRWGLETQTPTWSLLMPLVKEQCVFSGHVLLSGGQWEFGLCWVLVLPYLGYCWPYLGVQSRSLLIPQEEALWGRVSSLVLAGVGWVLSKLWSLVSIMLGYPSPDLLAKENRDQAFPRAIVLSEPEEVLGCRLLQHLVWVIRGLEWKCRKLTALLFLKSRGF